MKKTHLQLNLSKTEVLVFPVKPCIQQSISLGWSDLITLSSISSPRICSLTHQKDQTVSSAWLTDFQNMPPNFLFRHLGPALLQCSVNSNTSLSDLSKWSRLQQHKTSLTSQHCHMSNLCSDHCTGFLLLLASYSKLSHCPTEWSVQLLLLPNPGLNSLLPTAPCQWTAPSGFYTTLKKTHKLFTLLFHDSGRTCPLPLAQKPHSQY